MRVATLISFTALLISSNVAGGAQPAPEHLEHPGEVALHEAAPGLWRYRTFPALMPLYVYDQDSPGQSNCYRGCKAAWPPVKAREDAEPVGDWTIIIRSDKLRQWAYKGRPVYLRYHDRVGAPLGDGEEGEWHLLQP